MKQISSIICIALLMMNFASAQLPFKYDSLYKTIYAKDLCKLVQKNPDLLLIDVRSPGEYSDTSQSNSLNLGHLKGAINIEIGTIAKDINTISQYKDRTIVFYCSHSQRSRKVNKFLTEKGFTNIYNLNGGMSVLNQLTEAEFPCKNEWIESTLPYKNKSYNESSLLIKKGDAIILDVRPAPEFNSIDTNTENNVGRIKGAINIPYSELKQRLNELSKYKQQSVLVYTTSGDGDAARAALVLLASGFTNVYHMLGGINNFIASQEDISFIENRTPYILLNSERALKLLKNKKELAIYDTRANDEYENKLTGRNSYKNLGHIKSAIHVEEAFFNTYTIPEDKNTSLLIYGDQESIKFAAILSAKGYKHIYLLSGLYDFVWSSFNVEACKEGKKFLVDHENLY